MKQLFFFVSVFGVLGLEAQVTTPSASGVYYIAGSSPTCIPYTVNIDGGTCGTCITSGHVTSGLQLYVDASNPSSYSGSGTTWNDLSGNGYNGTLSSGVTFSSTASGKYFQLSDVGINSVRYVSFPVNPTTLLTNGVQTLQWWVWVDAYWHPGDPTGPYEGNEYAELYYAGSQFFDNRLVQMVPNGIKFCYVTSGGALSSTTILYGSNTNDQRARNAPGVWLNIACVIDITNGIFKYFKNGQYVGSAGFPTNIRMTGTTYARLGSNYATANIYDQLRGRIASFALYNRELTQSEIQQNYDVSKGCYCDHAEDDADASTFIATAGITDTYQKAGLHHMVRKLKQRNLWNSIQALWPLCNCTSTTRSYNLKNPTTFQLTFFGSPVHYKKYTDWNGSTTYANTGFVPSTHLANINSSHLMYFTDKNIAENSVEIGVYGTNTASAFQQALKYGDGNGYFESYYNNATARITVSGVSSSQGIWILNRTSGTDAKVWKYGRQQGATLSTASIGSLPTSPIFLGAQNLTANGGTGATGWSTKGVNVAAVGEGISDIISYLQIVYTFTQSK